MKLFDQVLSLFFDCRSSCRMKWILCLLLPGQDWPILSPKRKVLALHILTAAWSRLSILSTQRMVLVPHEMNHIRTTAWSRLPNSHHEKIVCGSEFVLAKGITWLSWSGSNCGQTACSNGLYCHRGCMHRGCMPGKKCNACMHNDSFSFAYLFVENLYWELHDSSYRVPDWTGFRCQDGSCCPFENIPCTRKSCQSSVPWDPKSSTSLQHHARGGLKIDIGIAKMTWKSKSRV